MSVETILRTTLTPLLTGGCHNVVNRSATIVYPYAVFYQISGLPVTGISVPYMGITETRYQIDVFAKSQEQAKGIALDVIRPAIEASELEGLLVFEMNGQYSEVTKTFQYITEYQIWAA